jgi:hypothetical protein
MPTEKTSRYFKAILLGLCGLCYKRQPTGGKKYCKKCLDVRALNKKSFNIKQRKKYLEQHKCLSCSAPLEEEDTRYCFNCRHGDTKREGRRT